MKPWSLISTLAAGLACMTACATAPALPGAPSSEQLSETDNPRLFEDENVLILLQSEQEANELAVNVSRRGYQLIERRKLEGLGLILLDFQRPSGVSDEVAVVVQPLLLSLVDGAVATEQQKLHHG